ncbi:unnamed protein product, partial [Oppiella nova]
VIIAWISCVAYGRYVPKYQEDGGDVEFVTGSPGSDGPGYSGPRNVFKDWMKFVQGFFKDGNWENGGPANFARFIGNQVSKLVEMLTKNDNFFSKRK